MLCRQLRRTIQSRRLGQADLQSVVSDRLVHMVLAVYLTTALMVGAVAAFHLLPDQHLAGLRVMFSMAIRMGNAGEVTPHRRLSRRRLGAAWRTLAAPQDGRALRRRLSPELGSCFAKLGAIVAVSLATPFVHIQYAQRWFSWPNMLFTGAGAARRRRR
jgi:hypothetical protein